MTTNTNLITTFYDAFERRDYAGMNACYHPDIHFSDPVFTDLYGNEVRAMWHMLCQRGAGLDVTFGDVHAEDGTGSAHWEARYTLTNDGPQIHNVVEASFEFRDHLIVRHIDDFDLWAWTRMALGYTGTLLGWSPPIQNKVRSTARASLDKFMAAHPEYES
jgi:ketosteroid isomerase-like protein